LVTTGGNSDVLAQADKHFADDIPINIGIINQKNLQLPGGNKLFITGIFGVRNINCCARS
ncbi:hypothetical protein SEEN0624_19233, partial [Salmonella enterica subsp. enterica serovar Newport str. PRS_2010_0624]